MRHQMLKKAIAMAAALASAAALAACGSSEGKTESAEAGTQAAASEQQTQESKAEDAAAETADGKTLKVGIIQMIENGAFNDMREGFIQELRDKGYGEDRLVIDYKNAQGDASNLQTIAQGMADGSYDLVATIATPPTQAMVNTGTETPVIFVSVSDPLAAGVITDMEKPDKNATGTSNAIPIEDIFSLSKELTPDAKTFGFLYCTSEVNSVSTVKNAKAYCDENGISYKEAVVTNSSEVQQAAQSLAGEVDAIFIPNDSVVQSAMTLVSQIARDAKIPVYASSATTVASGAFATVAISDKEIGAKSADMAIQYFEGTPIADIPSVVVPASETVINRTTMEALGLSLADDGAYTFVEDAQ